MSQARRARLQAYRELYTAVCSLSDTLYEDALAVTEDEKEAAFAASCALVAKLTGGRRSRASRHGILNRIDALAFGMPRRHARRVEA